MTANVNVTAITFSGADDAASWSYRLTNATYDTFVAYDGKGEGVIMIELSMVDLNALKLADGDAGEAPLATTVYNTYVGLDASFLLSEDGTLNVPRVTGNPILGAVQTYEMLPDAVSYTHLTLPTKA